MSGNWYPESFIIRGASHARLGTILLRCVRDETKALEIAQKLSVINKDDYPLVISREGDQNPNEVDVSQL